MLAGDSSAGKASVAQELQTRLGEPLLHVGVDHFFSMFPHHWKDHPRGPGPGFWYDDSADDDGAPLARIRYGDAGGRLLAGMRAAVNGLLATGNDVILDEMPIEASTMPTWRRDLRASASCWVYVTAPLEVLERRERERMSGRKSGNARGHHRLGQGGDWDMVVNTDTATPGDAAAEIIRRCPFL